MRMRIIIVVAPSNVMTLPCKKKTPVRCDRRATHFSNLFNVACKRRQITTTVMSSVCVTPGPDVRKPGVGYSGAPARRDAASRSSCICRRASRFCSTNSRLSGFMCVAASTVSRCAPISSDACAKLA